MSELELRATYRLQLGSGFGFAQARELVPYLRDLGISHLYLSPSFQARPGSSHGYDVIDPGRVSEELGGEGGLHDLSSAARGAGIGIVLDIVPNHMAADPANRCWASEKLRERFFDVDPVSGRWRRFFDIDQLAGVRQEFEEVFLETHGLALRLVREGVVDGLRVDHPDGLADPSGYLERLRAGGVSRVWVEKILGVDERLPASWPVCGSVGYEFLNDVCALFVDPAGEGSLTALWERVSGDRRPFGAWALDAKLEQARGTFRPEVERLARVPGAPDADAIALALSVLPVYRGYVPPSAGEFVTRFQQTSPAIMAKGVEDTAFYRYGRLVALNEVGGEPYRFGLSVASFHAACAERAIAHPDALLTTMTHDAKRSADVRARIAALAGVASEWCSAVDRWMSETARRRSARGAPDDIERYFVLQTLAGCWPLAVERVCDYMVKALREAKRNSNWIAPDEEWEAGVVEFVRSLAQDAAFLESFEPFVASLAVAGERIALGWLALKLTAPGIPDIYQGDELEFRALVDPDNRRPVDWDLRQAHLRRLMGGGRPVRETRKLWLMMRLLGLRARRPEPFAGGYEPLPAGDEVCAFVRGGEVLVVVPVRAGVEAGDAVLSGAPGGRWRDLLSGEERSFGAREPVAGLLSELGLAVYERL